jgi:hypothetical protein
MATTHISLKPLEVSESVRNDTQKLANLEKSLGDLTTELINKDIDTIESETTKIEGFAHGINSVLTKLNLYKT